METGINRFGNKPNGLGKQKSLINGTEGCRLSSSVATASIQHPMHIIWYVLQKKWGVLVNPSNLLGIENLLREPLL